jgi:thiosulfate dehydrogenase
MRRVRWLAMLPVVAACGDGPAPAPAVPGAAPLAGTIAVSTLPVDQWPARGAVPALPLPPFPDSRFGEEAARGLAILEHTADSLPGHVGNTLRCTSCHLDGGRRPYAMPWVGVTARYPQYRSRADRVLTIEDRIHECIERSLAGRRLPHGDERTRAMLAYFRHLSEGVPEGARVPGQGVDSARAGAPDVARGATVYAAQCARCHGADGAGLPSYPAVWGDGAYTIAAGMARVGMAAAFIKRNMPFDAAGTLSDQEAVDVAAYLNAQPRPDYAPKSGDWPAGRAPADVPYRTATAR